MSSNSVEKHGVFRTTVEERPTGFCSGELDDGSVSDFITDCPCFAFVVCLSPLNPIGNRTRLLRSAVGRVVWIAREKNENANKAVKPTGDFRT